MRVGILIAGVILLIVGLIGAGYGMMTSSYGQSVYSENCVLGPFNPSACNELAAAISVYQTIAAVCGAIAFVGIILLILGIVSQAPGAMPPPYPPYGYPPQAGYGPPAPTYPAQGLWPPAPGPVGPVPQGFPPPSASPTPTAPPPEMMACASCRRLIAVGTKFCVHCGAPQG